MENLELLRSITRNLLTYIENDTTFMSGSPMVNQADIYTAEALLGQEKAKLFDTLPQLVCFSRDLPNKGSFLAVEHMSKPVLLVRDKQGLARAFLNICPHRNSKLKQGSGQCHFLVCPYHAWSFELDGKLNRIYAAETVGDLDKQDYQLTSLPCEEVAGMVFISLSPGQPISVASHLEDMLDALARWELDKLTKVSSRMMEIKCNWKLAVETFGEGYHFEPLHRKTVGDYAIGNCSHFDRFGPDGEHHRLAFPNKWIKQLAGKSEEEWGTEEDLFANFQLVHFIFPNVILLISPREVEFFQIYPGSSASSHTTVYTSYVRKSDMLKTDEQQQAALDHFRFIVKVVTEEDYDVVSSIQRSHEATGGERAFTCGRNEPALINFHRQLEHKLSGCKPV
ncbi:aromatic ring-hydroxylating dioxygenase subunit alpha [Shewanella corallii]|uniref:Aromatic ring-hydroxylating dioxygenase subunit alpha n=1 Tax=Shewanella corallii TaxID=560080 RepID=A0ABT0NAM4_9GAMM|nr:aromatic ring-hydroxylating dioxygenase subunit alpha [Shewanella corallii]MCL2915507.1 aromatic ring-hydroxylating dioxygenase subunit alpha [Shewanella corallii]